MDLRVIILFFCIIATAYSLPRRVRTRVIKRAILNRGSSSRDDSFLRPARQAAQNPRVQYVRVPARTVEAEYPPAHYHFQYAVNDEETGDVKSQEETREDKIVTGSYTVLQPDGNLRTVDYADRGDGFEAVVKYKYVGFKQRSQVARVPIRRPAVRRQEPVLQSVDSPVESNSIAYAGRPPVVTNSAPVNGQFKLPYRLL